MSSMPALAWSGFDYENSTFVDIDKGSLVRRGKEIDIYDYSRGYIPVEIERILGRAAQIAPIDIGTKLFAGDLAQRLALKLYAQSFSEILPSGQRFSDIAERSAAFFSKFILLRYGQ